MDPFQHLKAFIRLNRGGDVSPELRSKLFAYVLLAVASFVVIGILSSSSLMHSELVVRLLQVVSVLLLASIWWFWKRGMLDLASYFLVIGFWLMAGLVVLSEGGRASHWLVPQFLLIILARFILNGRVAILLGVATAALDYSLYRYDLNQYLPAGWRELGAGNDWRAIAISLLFLLFIFYIADTVLRETLSQARLTEGRYRNLFDKSNDAISIIGPDLNYLEVNQNAADLLGYKREQLIGKSVFETVPQDERKSVERYIAQIEKEGTLPPYERTLMRADGSRRIAEVSVNVVTDERGRTVYFQSVMRDISERKRLEEQLRLSLGEMEALAMQDPLTGLLNRRAITDHAEAEWHRARRDRRPFCVALIDLDNLKTINDSLGHQVGDRVIEQLASTVRKTLRRYDWAGRWGGDEFMLVLPGTNLVEAQDIVERLRSHYTASEIITEMKGDLNPYLSVGIACFSGRPGDEVTPGQLFGQADRALYHAKQGGKDRIEVYRDSVDAP